MIDYSLLKILIEIFPYILGVIAEILFFTILFKKDK